MVAHCIAAMARLSDSDEGKTVVSSAGDKIGIIKEVSRGAAHVDPDPGITDELKSKMGWADRDEDTYPLDESNIDAVTDDEVRLTR